MFKELLEKKVNKESGCWVWEGKPWHKQYVSVQLGGVVTKAHIQAYKEFNGPIADGLIVRHTCDNKRCVNPEHLILGTRSENTQDMLDRHPRYTAYRARKAELREI